MAGPRLEVLRVANGARTGVLHCAAGRTLKTPALLTGLSRGVVPHLTPDNAEMAGLEGLYLGAEDFMERVDKNNEVNIMKYPGKHLRDVLPLPDSSPLIVGPRRYAPLAVPRPNSDTHLSVSTSEGVRQMPLSLYNTFAVRMGADMVVSPPDMANLSPGGKPGGNRTRKMVNRTQKWLDGLLGARDGAGAEFAVLAPMLTQLGLAPQREYLDYVYSQITAGRVAGIALCDGNDRLPQRFVNSLSRRAGHEANATQVSPPVAVADLLEHFPEESLRIYGGRLETPQDILDAVAAGFDVVQGSCATEFSDAGVALDFTFPANEQQPSIGTNLWDGANEHDMTPLGVAAPTGAGETYRRAYVHHLLNANEMSAWVYLQLHNVQVMQRFFDGVRSSIADGTFDIKCSQFVHVYGDRDAAVALRDKYLTKDSGPTARGHTVSYEDEQRRKVAGKSGRLNDPSFDCSLQA